MNLNCLSKHYLKVWKLKPKVKINRKIKIKEVLTTQTFMYIEFFKPAQLQTSISTKTTTKHFSLSVVGGTNPITF